MRITCDTCSSRLRRERRSFLFVFVALVLGLFALPQMVPAVTPAPDGGYPGHNTAEGEDALLSIDPSGNFGDNTAIGYHAMMSTYDGYSNTAVGSGAMANVQCCSQDNTAVGAYTLAGNVIGKNNTAMGYAALYAATGSKNVAVGSWALAGTTGSFNTATGQAALQNNTSGHNNTATGRNALMNVTTGSNNIGVGSNAGNNLTTGDNNIDIFHRGVAGEANTIRIGKQGTQTATYIAGIYSANEGGTIKPVYVNSNGQLGTQPPGSSERFKTNIKPMADVSNAVLELKPVTFEYKSDGEATPQFGLIAEQVEKVDPDLVIRDESGQVYTVRYDAVNAMLLNEFLKEHGQVQQLKATLAQQQKQIEALTATVQKVRENKLRSANLHHN